MTTQYLPSKLVSTFCLYSWYYQETQWLVYCGLSLHSLLWCFVVRASWAGEETRDNLSRLAIECTGFFCLYSWYCQETQRGCSFDNWMIFFFHFQNSIHTFQFHVMEYWHWHDIDRLGQTFKTISTNANQFGKILRPCHQFLPIFLYLLYL